ncbi:acyl-CoA reductase [Flavobacteriales bacterium]|nr:acyl-CoA reductase [Flavobacteriales bacterium]
MQLKDRIEVLVQLGDFIDSFLKNPDNHEWSNLIDQAYALNNWFTRESILSSFQGIRLFLRREALETWTTNYPIDQEFETSKRVGAILAGNLPMVGFHDLLCVFVSGHKFLGKLSSDDRLLMMSVVQKMTEIDKRVLDYITWKEQLKDGIDAVIATGSNNSARYFHHYFGKYPHVIRKNRNSVAVLTGNETKEQLKDLGKDIFQYYGLGCRNVSKLFLPNGYNIDQFYEGIFEFGNVIDHNKYNNNYSYNRTVYLMQDTKFFDNNFLLLKEDNSMHSPIGAIYFETYSEIEKVKSRLEDEEENIQCLVTEIPDLHPRQVGFGEAQIPQLDDYADGLDTMAFLANLE